MIAVSVVVVIIIIIVVVFAVDFPRNTTKKLY